MSRRAHSSPPSSVTRLPPAWVPFSGEVGGGSDGWADSRYAREIRAADLTARVLTAAKYQALESALAALARVGCRPVLLKGVATALQYYPAPHLRTMGDIDLLVTADERSAAKTELRSVGFTQRSHQPVSAFVQRHHSMPFWHPERDVWIDVHTRAYPLQYPLARDPRFAPEALASQWSDIAVGDQMARVMNDELQLVYTSTRWLERFDAVRGLYPVLDGAGLLQRRAGGLDWDVVCARIEGSWAVTALHVFLACLRRWELAPVPGEVLSWLAANDPYTNRMSIAVLRHVFTRHVLKGHPFGLMLTRSNVEIIWSTLVLPGRPGMKLISVPYHVACPPRRVHGSPPAAGRRIGTLLGRILRPTGGEAPGTQSGHD